MVSVKQTIALPALLVYSWHPSASEYNQGLSLTRLQAHPALYLCTGKTAARPSSGDIYIYIYIYLKQLKKNPKQTQLVGSDFCIGAPLLVQDVRSVVQRGGIWWDSGGGKQRGNGSSGRIPHLPEQDQRELGWTSAQQQPQQCPSY